MRRSPRQPRPPGCTLVLVYPNLGGGKRFIYVCAGILLLVVAYSIGAHRADAQLGGQFVGVSVDAMGGSTTAVTSTGDIYARAAFPICNDPQVIWSDVQSHCRGWIYMGKVLGGPIKVQGKSMSDVKSSYRGK